MGSSYNRSYFNNLNGLFFKDNQICLSIPSSIDDEESTDYFVYDLNYIKSEIDRVNSKLGYLNLSIEDNYYDGVSIVLNDSKELFDETNQKWEFDEINKKEFIDMFRNELADDYNIVFEFIKNKIENDELEMYSESRGCGWSADSAISYDDSINKLNEAKEHFEKMLSFIQLDVNKIKNLNITISDKYYFDSTCVEVNAVDRELIENVWIENGIDLIDAYTFEDCKNLKSISIPDSVTKIGVGAFKGCENLKSIEIPNSVEEIGEEAFEYCESLVSIIIPNDVIEIKNAAFYSCSNLKSIKLPSNLISISHNAFAHCENIKSIEIPNNVTRIGNWAFQNCTNLESFELPNSLTEIGENAFWGCTNLESITIPDNVTKIGDCAFFDCTSLKSITIPEKFKYQLDDIGIDASKVKVEFTKSNEREM